MRSGSVVGERVSDRMKSRERKRGLTSRGVRSGKVENMVADRSLSVMD